MLVWNLKFLETQRVPNRMNKMQKYLLARIGDKIAVGMTNNYFLAVVPARNSDEKTWEGREEEYVEMMEEQGN